MLPQVGSIILALPSTCIVQKKSIKKPVIYQININKSSIHNVLNASMLHHTTD